MDPLSITAASASLVASCFKLSEYLYKFINKNVLVNKTVGVLGREIDLLSQVLCAINTSFDDPILAKAVLTSQTGHEAQHWANVKRSMIDCKDTLDGLERVLMDVNKVDGKSFWRPRKVIKLGMKDELISLFKQQIAAYRQTMQLSLQLITVSSVLSNEALSENLASRLDGLTIEIHKALHVVSARAQDSTPEATINNNDSRVTSNLEACVRSAGKLVSSAATIVSSRSVGGSQGGSLYQEELSDHQRRRVEQWIQNPIIFEDPNEPLGSSLSAVDTQSSTQSEIFSDYRAETTITSLTSPASEYNKMRFIDAQNEVREEHPLDEEKYYLEDERETVEEQMSPALDSPDNPNLIYTNDGVSSLTVVPEIKSIIAPEVETLEAPFIDVTPVADCSSDSGSDMEADLIKEWWKSGISRFAEREYEGAELLLERTLQHSESKYGKEFPRREDIFGALASACAHQGKRERVEELLDGYTSAADWKHRALEILVSSCLGEGKWNQANEILVKYDEELEGKDDTLLRLVSTSSKHGGWSVAARIVGRYSQFHGRERVLETCISICREQSKWDEAEVFLVELLKEKPANDIEASKYRHTLAEVCLAKGDLKSAQLSCQKAVAARRKAFGKKDRLFQESVYLIAKIIYEVKGDPIEFEGYRNQLPPKIQECLDLEILFRMRPADAVRELGNSLLKELSSRNPSKSSNVDWESINTTIKSCGVIGTTARNSDTLLHAFAESGNELAVQWLLKMGARVSTLGKSGYTALYLAVEKGHEPVIRSLLNGGATVDAQDSKQDPLFRAATLGRVATVRLLLEHRKGSNWAAPELLYQTALNGHAQVIQVLLENGAKDDRSHLQDDSVYFKTAARALRARTALHEAVARGFSVAIIELLVHRDNIRTADKNDNTALHEAALGQSVATVEVLINNGADIHAVNFEGRTALHRAVCKSPSSVAIVKLLLEKGAVVDAIDDDGNTPLQLAVFKDELCLDIVEVLLNFGANVKGTEKLVKSALTESVLRGAAPLVDLLLDNGADIAGLLQLRFNESDYASLVGSLTADKILQRLSSQRRTNSLNTDTRSTLLPRGARKLSRKWTTCTFSLVRI